MKTAVSVILVAIGSATFLYSYTSLSVEATPYKGFRIDYSAVKEDPKLEAIRVAVNRQIDMVTEVGLPEKTLQFFREVPVAVVAGRHPFAGRYIPKGKRIELSGNFLLSGRKPVLMHEFLHAYHAQKMPQGVKDPEIITFYERAKDKNGYAPESHMMQGPGEFFASTGTAYLFGVTLLEPFTREKVQTKQPVYYKFLEKLFGPDAGSYKGSLNENVAALKQAKSQEPESEKNGE